MTDARVAVSEAAERASFDADALEREQVAVEACGGLDFRAGRIERDAAGRLGGTSCA